MNFFLKIVLSLATMLNVLSGVFAQHQFQKNYGLGHTIQNVSKIKNEQGRTTILFRPGSCFDTDNHANCFSIGFLSFDTSDSIVNSVILKDANLDTNYFIKDFYNFPNGDILACGTLFNTAIPSGNSCLLVLDSNFSFQTGKCFQFNGGNFFMKVISNASDSNYYVLGFLDSLNTMNSETFLVSKIDPTLSMVWSKSYTSLQKQTMADFEFMDDGNIVICGTITDSLSVYTKILLTKIDTNGNIIWAKKYSTQKFASANSIIKNSDGFVLCGAAYDSIYNKGSTYLMKLDSSGNIEWCKKYVSSAVSLESMIQTLDGGFLISSQHYHPSGGASLTKTDSLGNVQWNYYYQSGRKNLNLTENSQHEFYTVGESHYGTTSLYDSVYIFLVKTDSSGSTGCLENPFNINISTDNNFTVNQQPIVSTDYVPPSAYFNLVRDTLPLNEIVFCDGFTGVGNPNSNIAKYNIYPNPTFERLNVNIETTENSNLKINITDITGNLISQSKNIVLTNRNEISLDVSHFSNGVYIISFETEKGITRKRFIKQN